MPLWQWLKVSKETGNFVPAKWAQVELSRLESALHGVRPMFRFAFPSCGASLSAPEDCAGRMTQCHNCRQPIAVPTPAHHSTPPPPREKTGLGRLISHVPTSLTSATSSSGEHARPPAKLQVPARTIPASPSKFERPLSQSDSRRPGLWLAVILLVFAAGTLGGWGIVH